MHEQHFNDVVESNSQLHSGENEHFHSMNNGASRSGNGSGQARLDVRFLVCSRDAGAIIGKKGSNIQTLRQKHKAIIQVPDCDVSAVNTPQTSSLSLR